MLHGVSIIGGGGQVYVFSKTENGYNKAQAETKPGFKVWPKPPLFFS